VSKVVICGNCGNELPSGIVACLDSKTIAAAINDDATPLIVGFLTPAIQTSRRMEPELDEAAKTMRGAVRLAKVNLIDNPKLAATMKITGVPTLVLFHKGRELARLRGQRTAEEILAFSDVAAPRD
jgi:thioredoxin 2